MKTEIKLRPLDTIESALLDIKQGKMVIVVDDENRENEGDFVMAAELVTPAAINFMITQGKGLVCAPISQEIATRLELDLQSRKNTDSMGTAFTVTIDAKENIHTGISAQDRAYTLQLLSRPTAKAQDFTRPGHIFPLIAKNGGVLERPGHTEAAVDLAKLAGLNSAGVICEIINEDGSMARLPDLMILAEKYDLKIISIDDLIAYRKIQENLISQVETIPFPTQFGDFNLYIFRSEILKQEHIAIVKGNIDLLKNDSTLVRLHSECFTGDIFGSYRCDCGDQLELSLQTIEKKGSGILVYLRQEGRGIGLFNKIRAYQLQDQGADTVDANIHLGFPADMRDYTMASQIMKYFEIKSINLMTNNPQKIEGLRNLGHKNVERFPLEIEANTKNEQYLLTKKTRMGHLLKQNKFNQ